MYFYTMKVADFHLYVLNVFINSRETDTGGMNIENQMFRILSFQKLNDENYDSDHIDTHASNAYFIYMCVIYKY